MYSDTRYKNREANEPPTPSRLAVAYGKDGLKASLPMYIYEQ
jgi:hypothetical protein